MFIFSSIGFTLLEYRAPPINKPGYRIFKRCCFICVSSVLIYCSGASYKKSQSKQCYVSELGCGDKMMAAPFTKHVLHDIIPKEEEKKKKKCCVDLSWFSHGDVSQSYGSLFTTLFNLVVHVIQ